MRLRVAGRPAPHPRGPRPSRPTLSRAGLYLFLVTAAAFFLLPAWVMVATSFKSMAEIRLGEIFSLPQLFDAGAWGVAWASACTGLDCSGIGPGFWNSVRITVPSVVISVAIGALNGYALSFWRPVAGRLLFGLLMVGAFIPLQIFMYPMVRLAAALGLYNTLAGIVAVHVVFGLPLVTLLFRNYYAGIPEELFKAARADGAGFWRTFTAVMLPMSTPMIAVASIMQLTGIWNDFILGLVFAGRDNLPMTVQLNNIVNTTTSERLYNVNMAATIITAAVPLLAYFLSGRMFLRGIAAGAIKG